MGLFELPWSKRFTGQCNYGRSGQQYIHWCGVSKHTSANWPRRTCSSLAATFENIIRPPGKPAIQSNRSNNNNSNTNSIRIPFESYFCGALYEIIYLNFVLSVEDLVHQRLGSEVTREQSLEHFSRFSPTIPMSTDRFCTADWNYNKRLRCRAICTVVALLSQYFVELLRRLLPYCWFVKQ